MAYADITDINLHLPEDKAQIEDAQATPLLIDAQRLVRARLFSCFDSATLNSWTNPALTPEIIREITGKLVAAKFYAILVAEDDSDGSKYAQDLYNDAIQMLNDIKLGNNLTVIDPSGNEVTVQNLTEASFYPNNTAPNPSFAIGEIWS
jgi:hypothetical protein